MWIQACGLIHSILVTVPRNLMGLLESNSAANAWCAQAGAALTSKLMVAIAIASPRRRGRTAVGKSKRTLAFVAGGLTNDLVRIGSLLLFPYYPASPGA